MTNKTNLSTKPIPASPVNHSRVKATHLVLPSHTNTHGNLFGGKLMEWIDSTAAMSAMRHSRMPSVTASIDDLHFLTPIQLGDIVHIVCEVVYTGATSMEIEANVIAEAPYSGQRQCNCVAYMTFVALDESNGRPTPVAKVVAESADEKERFARAKARKLERIARLKKHPVECRLIDFC